MSNNDLSRRSMVDIPFDLFERILNDFENKYSPEIVDLVDGALFDLCKAARTDYAANSFVSRLYRNWKPGGNGHVASDVAADFLINYAPGYLSALKIGDTDTQASIANGWKYKLGPDELHKKASILEEKVAFPPLDRLLHHTKDHIKLLAAGGGLYVGYFASPQTSFGPCTPMACAHRYQMFDNKLFQSLG
jgi:hypothetical protein